MPWMFNTFYYKAFTQFKVRESRQTRKSPVFLHGQDETQMALKLYICVEFTWLAKLAWANNVRLLFQGFNNYMNKIEMAFAVVSLKYRLCYIYVLFQFFILIRSVVFQLHLHSIYI
jgi:hypothetical protein